jgi:hypothetical protein
VGQGNAEEKTTGKESKDWTVTLIWCVGLFAVVVIAAVITAAVLHFFGGKDLWWVEAKNVDTAAYWGQIGDFVGGMLNPFLSFFALVAVLASLRSQSAELKAARTEAQAARLEAQAAQSILEQQTQIFRQQSGLAERQNFESVFFGILQMYSRNAESVVYKNGSVYLSGREAYIAVKKKFMLDGFLVDKSSAIPGAKAYKVHAEDEFWKECRANFAANFLMLAEVLAYIDSLGSPLASKSFKKWKDSFLIGSALDSLSAKDERAVYARIVRATMGPAERAVLAFYCLTQDGQKICGHVAQFGLLDDFTITIGNEHLQAALMNAGAIRQSETQE